MDVSILKMYDIPGILNFEDTPPFIFSKAFYGGYISNLKPAQTCSNNLLVR